MWDIEYRYIEEWLDRQDEATVAHVFAALELLQERGPNLGRPLVDSVKGSSLRNLKELRPASPGRSEVRILFAFDADRNAIMLLAGDKSKGKNNKLRWSCWYRKAITQAIAIYEHHVRCEGKYNG